MDIAFSGILETAARARDIDLSSAVAFLHPPAVGVSEESKRLEDLLRSPSGLSTLRNLSPDFDVENVLFEETLSVRTTHEDSWRLVPVLLDSQNRLKAKGLFDWTQICFIGCEVDEMPWLESESDYQDYVLLTSDIKAMKTFVVYFPTFTARIRCSSVEQRKLLQEQVTRELRDNTSEELFSNKSEAFKQLIKIEADSFPERFESFRKMRHSLASSGIDSAETDTFDFSRNWTSAQLELTEDGDSWRDVFCGIEYGCVFIRSLEHDDDDEAPAFRIAFSRVEINTIMLRTNVFQIRIRSAAQKFVLRFKHAVHLCEFLARISRKYHDCDRPLDAHLPIYFNFKSMYNRLVQARESFDNMIQVFATEGGFEAMRLIVEDGDIPKVEFAKRVFAYSQMTSRQRAPECQKIRDTFLKAPGLLGIEEKDDLEEISFVANSFKKHVFNRILGKLCTKLEHKYMDLLKLSPRFQKLQASASELSLWDHYIERTVTDTQKQTKKLVVKVDENVEWEKLFSSSQTCSILIGTHKHCKIRVDKDNVSRIHGRVYVSEDYVEFFDLGSKNGSFLEHRAANYTKLRPGEKIICGAAEISLEDEEIAGFAPSCSCCQVQ